MSKVKYYKQQKYLIGAIFFATSIVVPSLATQIASAYGLPTSRSVKMSSSQISATAVKYTVTFTPSGSSTVKSLAVDFCGNTPIIGDTCTAPAGFTLATPTISAGGTPAGISSWTVGALNSGRTLTLTNATGLTFASGTPVSFEINGVTNPNTSGTFYARILTFPNDTTSNFATGYTDTNQSTNVPTDAGGVAMSTADQIVIQSKVQERIIFCVYTSAASFTTCSAVSTTNPVLLGDSNGVLSNILPSINKATKYNITTNASNNVIIRAKANTLTSGSFNINPVAGGDATGAAYASGTEQYGFCTYADSGSQTTTGFTAQSPYNSGTCSGTVDGQSAGNNGTASFGFDTTTANNNLTSTYGSPIATKTAGDFTTGVIAFLGSISNTTEPGIYTSNVTLIATGSY